MALGGLLLAATIALVLPVVAQTGLLDIAWWSADSGGGASAGGDYVVRGSAGQPDAGAASGGRYKITGGFWGPFGARQLPTTTPGATPTSTPDVPTPTSTPDALGSPTSPPALDHAIYLAVTHAP